MTNQKIIIKALIGFTAWLGGTIWLFLIDYRIGVSVTLIGLSISYDLKSLIKNPELLSANANKNV